MDSIPYNVTLSSQTASILYLPRRDVDLDMGWNVSYDTILSNAGSGYPQGFGNNFHRTSFAGATMEFQWTGTAVYLYGTASPGSYEISVDDVNLDLEENASSQDVLGSKSGLAYRNHKVRLTVVGGSQVVFRYAEVTIGMGDSGYVITWLRYVPFLTSSLKVQSRESKYSLCE
ncbi:hypothetical protein VKT23_006377 [Stygiomarasmius scandens]|uniref:PA14 domain-containing protein n=1 Tax=Marasmiellus scandens TaxID=2682957 RepID=A0ABR1JMM6_9AGAR